MVTISEDLMKWFLENRGKRDFVVNMPDKEQKPKFGGEFPEISVRITNPYYDPYGVSRNHVKMEDISRRGVYDTASIIYGTAVATSVDVETATITIEEDPR